MGRAPCCDKANVKKGPWSPEEDAKLKSYIEQHGTGGNWIALPQKIGLKRCGKSCRLRWLNYLRPNIKHGGFSEEEDNIICSLYISIGSRWSIIAAQLPGRTDNDIKNYWNTRLKKRLLGKQRKDHHHHHHQARKGSSKQETKRGTASNSMVPTTDINNNNFNNNQNPYWPELPVLAPIPYSNQEPCFNDHASIRKLLIKLGGRFSDHENHHQPFIHNATTNPQFSTDHHIPSSAPTAFSITGTSSTSQFAPLHHHYNSTDAVSNLQMLQGESNTYSTELEEMVYTNPQNLDGLEFLYDEANMIIVDSNGGGDHRGMGWGEMCNSHLVYPPSVPPDYEEAVEKQGLPQEYLFNELHYQRPAQ